jgi:hypothetical protein
MVNASSDDVKQPFLFLVEFGGFHNMGNFENACYFKKSRCMTIQKNCQGRLNQPTLERLNIKLRNVLTRLAETPVSKFKVLILVYWRTFYSSTVVPVCRRFLIVSLQL